MRKCFNALRVIYVTIGVIGSFFIVVSIWMIHVGVTEQMDKYFVNLYAASMLAGGILDLGFGVLWSLLGVAGIGLLKRKNWGRVLGLISVNLNLLAVLFLWICAGLTNTWFVGLSALLSLISVWVLLNGEVTQLLEDPDVAAQTESDT